MIFTKAQFAAKIAKLESTLTSMGGTIPPRPKNEAPSFYQAHGKNRIAQLEAAISARKNPQSLLPQNMSMESAVAIAERAARENPHSKTPILHALAKAHLAEEKQREAKATASAPVRPASAPAAAAPIKPAAAPAAVMPSAASIASAILDETEKRRVASLSKTRAEFSAMSPADCMKFCKAGGRIVN